MKSTFKKIFASEGLRQSLVTIVGNTLATGMSAIALLFISRILGPIQFGEFSVGFAIIIMLNKFNDIGLNAAILKFAGGSSDFKFINSIFGFTARIKLVASLAILCIGLVISPWLSSILRFESPITVYLAFILSFASSWYEHLLTVLQALRRFSQAVTVNALQAGSKMVGILSMYFLGVINPITVFCWYMLSPVLPLLLHTKLLPPKVSFTSIKHALSKSEQSAVFVMAKHSAVGFIAAGIIENIDVLFVQRHLSTYETGLLGGVSKIAMMISLAAYSLGNVLYPRVARYTSKEHLAPYFKKAVGIIFLSVVGFILFIPFARVSILLTIGSEYLSGTPVLYLLAAGSFLTMATIPFLALFYSFKADWYFSISGVVQLIIILVGNAVFVPTYGLAASAWTRVLARIFLFLFTLICAVVLYKKSINHEKSFNRS